MGKLTISMAMFNSELLVYQRVKEHNAHHVRVFIQRLIKNRVPDVQGFGLGTHLSLLLHSLVHNLVAPGRQPTS